jgi:hypothetical protein
MEVFSSTFEEHALLWWYEIAWLHRWPQGLLQQLYMLLEEADCLEVWASIVGTSAKYGELMAQALAHALPGGEIVRSGRRA